MQIILNQMDITDYQVSVNAAAILKSIHDNQACDGFMIFPELALTGFPTLDNIEALYHQSTEHFHSILEASKNTDSTIIIGHIDKQDQLFYNACSFIKNGKIIHKHRKSKLWLDDVGVFTSGEDLSVVSINDVVCGAQICFELEFPEGSRALAKKGAQIIFMPNGNMSPYANNHYVLTQARAIENQCFVITCNGVGVGHGGQFVGESLIVSPTGSIIKKLGSSPDIVTVDIDLEELEQSKQNYQYIDLS